MLTETPVLLDFPAIRGFFVTNSFDSILFLLYTGLRISEMIDLKTETVDLEAGTITGGTKTAAGKNRLVPIHSKIQSIVQKRMVQR